MKITQSLAGIRIFLLCVVSATIALSCKKENTAVNIIPAVVLPTLTTTAPTAITASTAVSGGIISNDGGAPITARGLCWNTSQIPTIAANYTTDGNDTGNFTSNITGLAAGTTYYARSYATNSAGTAYGNEISFSTAAVINDSVYVHFNVRNSSYSYLAPADSIRTEYYVSGGTGYVFVEAVLRSTPANTVTFVFNTTNIAVGSSHMLTNLLSTDLPPLSYTILTPTDVHITELGGTGEYLSGNFSGEVRDANPPNAMIPISGHFRLPRLF